MAAAEATKAGDKGDRQVWLLVVGIAGVLAGSMLKIPMSAFVTAFIGNIRALSMLGTGFLLRVYEQPVTGIDIDAWYIPHGMMFGAGLVALIQVVKVIVSRSAIGQEHKVGIVVPAEEQIAEQASK